MQMPGAEGDQAPGVEFAAIGPTLRPAECTKCT